MTANDRLDDQQIGVIPRFVYLSPRGRSDGSVHAPVTSIDMKRSTRRVIARSWGYILLAVLAYGWFGAQFGAGVLAVLSGAVVVFCLFQAPVWCCAAIRGGGLCRNNAYGILLGCHLRQHKWQKMKMAVRKQSWSQLFSQVLTGLGGRAALVSVVAGVVSTIASITLLLVRA